MANTWEWKEYDDGSGGLRKPDGSSFLSYDMATKEYMFASDAEPGFFNDGNWNYYGDRKQFNLKEFAENAAVNDSINKAFDVSKSFILVKAPEKGTFYTSHEKSAYISKALDEILNAIDINGVKPEEIEALVRGKDAAEYGKKSLYFIRPNAKQIQAGLDWNWELSDAIKGYTIGENGECSKGEQSVMKIDDMQLFDSDAEAAEQAKEDGVKLIPKKELNFGHGNDMKNYRYIDTPENRKLLSKYLPAKKIIQTKQPITFDSFMQDVETQCGSDKSVKNILLQSASLIKNLDENSKNLLRKEFSKAEIRGQDSLVDFLDKKINPKKETKRSIQKSKDSDFERTR